MTFDELRLAVEAMFAEAREAEPHERSAMIHCLTPGGELTAAINVAFQNGRERTEGTLARYRKFTAAVGKEMLAAVAAQSWPATGTLVWRRAPEKDPGGVYMRCTVIPPGYRPLTEAELRALDER